MSEIYTKVVIDCTTGEEQIISLTEEEIADIEAMRFQAEAERLLTEEAAAAKEAAKASGIAKLLVLGLTQEEAEALINK
jgi:hypothetical protein